MSQNDFLKLVNEEIFNNKERLEQIASSHPIKEDWKFLLDIQDINDVPPPYQNKQDYVRELAMQGKFFNDRYQYFVADGLFEEDKEQDDLDLDIKLDKFVTSIQF